MKRIHTLLLLTVALALAACGGGGGTSSPGSTLTPTTPGQPSQPPNTISLGVYPTTLAGTKDAGLDSDFIITNTDKVSGYVWPFTWTLTGLPAGATYSQSTDGSHMRIYGLPTVSGSFTVRIVIRDATQAVKVDQNITLTLDTAFKLAGLPPGYVPPAVVGLPYSYHIDVANGVAPITYQLTTLSGQPGVIASGLTFNGSTGTFSGTATTTYPYSNLNLKVTDSSNPPRTLNVTAVGFEAVPALSFSDQSINLLRKQPVFSQLAFSGGVIFIKARVAAGSLPPGVTMQTDNLVQYVFLGGSPTQIGDWNATIELTDNYNPPEVKTANVHFRVNAVGPTVQTLLPHAVLGVPYSFHMSANNGTRPLTWSISGLPPGLTAGSDGVVTGTPTAPGNYSFQATVTDSSTPNNVSDTRSVPLTVKAFTGRNDSVATATAMSNGIFDASLSPHAPASNLPQPDQDYYKVVVAPGSTLHVVIDPLDAGPFPSPTDPVLEFVDAGGLRLANCRVPGGSTFSAACMNDDINPGIIHSSQLDLQNTTASDMTVYLHVLDWSGLARPDLLYRMTISGVK